MAFTLLIWLSVLKGIFSWAQIYDQQFHTNQFTDSDITNSWTITGDAIPTQKYFSQCNGLRIFGGLQILSGSTGNPAAIQKNYNNLPPHFQVRLQMKLYKIDSWLNHDLFILIDGITTNTFSWDSSIGTSDICGTTNPAFDAYNTNFKQAIIDFDETYSHTSTTLSLQLASTLDSLSGSWGFRQLTVTLQRCHKSCKSCADQSQCLTCNTPELSPSGAYCRCFPASKNMLFIEQCAQQICVQCYTNCPTGFIENVDMCDPCHESCSDCTGFTNTYTQCNVCANGYFSLNDGNNPMCRKCYGTCSSCFGLDFDECDGCQYESFLINSQCLSSCPDQFYADQSNALCVACSSPCLNCIGPSDGLCLSCESGKFFYNNFCYSTCPLSLYSYNLQCMQSCPIKTYSDSSNNCIQCPSYCLTCESNGCLSCQSGSYLNSIDFLCYPSCPANYFGDITSGLCVICDNDCLTCFGASSSECYSCYPGYNLVTNTCYKDCPTHTYPYECHQCHQICLNCTGPSQYECTSCVFENFYHINKTTCVEQCSVGQITNIDKKTCTMCSNGEFGQYQQCIQCSPSCYNCYGQLYCQCSECKQTDDNDRPLTLVNGLCIYDQTSYVYMPSLNQSPTAITQTIKWLIIINIVIAILVQFIFMYKTTIIIYIEFLQMLSYCYYLCTPLSLSNQTNLLFIYNTHISALLTINNIVPSLQVPIKQGTIPKALLLGKTSYYLFDTLLIHAIVLLLIIIYGLAKVHKGYLYKKINPYIISYGYRLLFMQHLLCIVLFLINLNLSDALDIGSLVLLIFDIILISLTMFWKIKTSTQMNITHLALFYFNELGSPPDNTQNQLTQNQIKQAKSIIPSLIFYIGKFPLIFFIFFFYQQPTTQALCLLIYCVLMSIVNEVLEYRRKIMKIMTRFFNICLVMVSMLLLILSFNIDVSEYLDILILLIILIVLIVTLMQIISNYLYIISIYYKGKQKMYKLCQSQEEKQ